jgi:hypothetical protein
MTLVQVSRLEGEIRRVKPGTVPVVELDLAPHQQLVSIELHRRQPLTRSDFERKTDDWNWTAYVATRLEVGT